jgi:hypothetical protein
VHREICRGLGQVGGIDDKIRQDGGLDGRVRIPEMLFGCFVLGGLLLGGHVRIDPWSKALTRFKVIRVTQLLMDRNKAPFQTVLQVSQVGWKRAGLDYAFLRSSTEQLQGTNFAREPEGQ